MTGARQYVIGTVLVAALTAALGAVLPEYARGLWVALAVGLLLQAPLGWWVVRAIGTDRLLLAWVVGMGARFAVVVVAGLVLVPALHWPLASSLVALVGVLAALMVVEIVAVSLGQPGTEGQ